MKERLIFGCIYQLLMTSQNCPSDGKTLNDKNQFINSILLIRSYVSWNIISCHFVKQRTLVFKTTLHNVFITFDENISLMIWN